MPAGPLTATVAAKMRILKEAMTVLERTTTLIKITYRRVGIGRGDRSSRGASARDCYPCRTSTRRPLSCSPSVA